ncbi:PREDICTED: leukocyte immunoglobulin-like receptor subfamily A member 6-like [Chrysochloris asiatica]|uniref:Leukocyte immunoglobulin-like receptor subfamily A member 6-like n=1 Tax=Chrysochloris asiatica TaxID=185453 RepID=A0A9B0WTL8_CHRAS|nr:PREDICTED: leukocyte immunoglobulin-like receptor subfamily A member 6-like [Chrysochloris asiatica]
MRSSVTICINGWSEWSDPLNLVVTGTCSKPSLSAHPSHVIASGGKMSFSYSSEFTLDTFHLLKEEETSLPLHMKSQLSAGRNKALFPLGPVNTSHRSIYRCCGFSSTSPHVWSLPSDPLDLEVTEEDFPLDVGEEIGG